MGTGDILLQPMTGRRLSINGRSGWAGRGHHLRVIMCPLISNQEQKLQEKSVGLISTSVELVCNEEVVCEVGLV